MNVNSVDSLSLDPNLFKRRIDLGQRVDSSFDKLGDHIKVWMDCRGDKLDDLLDRQGKVKETAWNHIGDRLDRNLDIQGDRIEEYFYQRAHQTSGKEPEKAAELLENVGKIIGNNFDYSGDVINRWASAKADRVGISTGLIGDYLDARSDRIGGKIDRYLNHIGSRIHERIDILTGRYVSREA